MRKKTLFAIINVQSAAEKYFTRKKGGNRKDTQTVVRVEKDKNNRNGSVPDHIHMVVLVSPMVEEDTLPSHSASVMCSLTR